MLRLACALALLAVGGLSEPVKRIFPEKTADPIFLKHQVNLAELVYHIHEPIIDPEFKKICDKFSFESNAEHFRNSTALRKYLELFPHRLLPKRVPFAVLNPDHKYEATTLFNVLYSAVDYDTFFNTAVYLRDKVNEALFIYVVYTTIIHRPDTQGLKLPPIHEVFPSFNFNGEVMTTAQRLNTHGKQMIEHYPGTYLWEDNVVIKWNETAWPYFSKENLIAYFTHDHHLNAFYYYRNLMYPQWLGGEVVPLKKDQRGEWFWYIHRQLLARYYMERLSNGLGEIPELGNDVVEQGYTPGLLYYNGIPFPSRPHHFHIYQPQFLHIMSHINNFEQRIRNAVDAGFFIDGQGKHIKIDTPESIDILGNLIEANVDSPNLHYYGDFITLWKQVLGNTIKPSYNYHDYHPLLLPSALEHYQTSLRDPAFYMIWKRVMHIFNMWHEHLPKYTHQELVLPGVNIVDVETDKLLTYFENTYVNVTNHLYMNEHERTSGFDDVSVLVQVPKLDHKMFQVRVKVMSEAEKTVVVKFFIAPKYDSNGYELPMYKNYQNFFQLDEFIYKLPQGETVIKRDSSDFMFYINKFTSGYETYKKALNSLSGKGPFVLNMYESIELFPQHLMLPKGHIGGMPFVFMVYISEYVAPAVPYLSTFDPAISYGLGTGARRMVGDRLGFPIDRPLYDWQIEGVHNLRLKDVMVHHKYTPEVHVPHNY